MSDPRQQCIDFILSKYVPNSFGATAIIVFENHGKKELINNACHASFVDTAYVNNQYKADTIAAMASAIQLSENNEFVAKKFWEWVSSKNSPWKTLFKNGLELIEDSSGNHRGFVISGEDVKKVPFNLVKNFAIVCRSLTENLSRWKLWVYLVSEKKMKEVDAWYLISCFTAASNQNPIDSDFKIIGLNFSDARAGGHWGLTDSSASAYIKTLPMNKAVFDFTRARTGNINYLPVPQINGFFCSQISERKCFSFSSVKIQKTGGKFSQAQYYDTDEIINEFYKWQDQEGILA